MAENSKPEHQKGLIDNIESMFRACEYYSYSKNEICNHFGVSMKYGLWHIDMSDSKEKRDRTQLVISIPGIWIEHEEVGASKNAFDHILKLLKEKYGVFEHWNGDEGHKSISVVIRRPIPESLLIGLKNYDKKSGASGFPKDTYGDKFTRNLREVLRK